MSTRRLISLTALLSFVVLSYSGLMLFVAPQGRVAYWTGWKLLGLSKEQFGQVHTTFMLLFLIVTVWHIVLNWKAIVRYVNNRRRETKIATPETVLASAIVLVTLVGTLGPLPPFGGFFDLTEGVKAYWERRDGSPPWGHAEQNTLERFTRGLADWERVENERSVSFDPEAVLAALRASGYRVASGQQTLIDIAEDNGTTPQVLMSHIRATATDVAAVDVGNVTDYPRPMSGLGRMSLREYADRYGLDVERLLQSLSEQDVVVDADESLKKEAARLGTDPEGLLELAWSPALKRMGEEDDHEDPT